jgi:hypothetical protein
MWLSGDACVAADGTSRATRDELGAATMVSVRLFQALHAGHCPTHLGEDAPHSEQT